MCFFKKKKKEPIIIDSKFKIGERIKFHNPRGELCIGYIYDIHQKDDGNLTYDIQIGGECPVIYYGYKEEDIK